MKVLVVIANHGTKNAEHLNRLLREYRSMSLKVDIVVLSNIPKDLGSDIEVIVGAPTKDPWSLPFGHKRIFDNVKRSGTWSPTGMAILQWWRRSRGCLYGMG